MIKSPSTPSFRHLEAAARGGNAESGSKPVQQRPRSRSVTSLQDIPEAERQALALPFQAMPGSTAPQLRHQMPRVASFGKHLASLDNGYQVDDTTHSVNRGLKTDKDDTAALLGEPVRAGWTPGLAFVVGVVMLCASVYGFNIGVLNVPATEVKETVAGSHPFDWSGGGKKVSSLSWTLVITAFGVGGWLGSVTNTLVDKFGRRRYLLFSSLIMMFGTLVEMGAWNWKILALGRFIVGIGGGTTTLVVPLYLGEISPPGLRGAIGTCNQFAVVIGLFIGSVLGKSDILGGNPNWRWLLAVSALPTIVIAFSFPFLVESPRWLLMRGRQEEARSVLRRLRGHDDVEFEVSTMLVVSSEEQSAPSMGDLIRNRHLRMSLIIGVAVNMAQQFSGINAVFYYSTTFFKSAGVNAYLGTVAATGVNVLATAVAVPLMDRLGRRLLLLIASGGMFASTVVITVSYYFLQHFQEAHDDSAEKAMGIVLVSGVLLFVSFFELGIGPIPWLIVAEIFPTVERATAMSLCCGVNWACNIIVALLFPTMSSSMGPASFIPFGVVLLSLFVFTWCFVIETKGKDVNTILSELNGHRIAKSGYTKI